jgi:hypothetical protein
MEQLFLHTATQNQSITSTRVLFMFSFVLLFYGMRKEHTAFFECSRDTICSIPNMKQLISSAPDRQQMCQVLHTATERDHTLGHTSYIRISFINSKTCPKELGYIHVTRIIKVTSRFST